jgi:hypothetical protein
LSIRTAASVKLTTVLGLHNLSATAEARGHILEMKFVESTYSAQRLACPPITIANSSAVANSKKKLTTKNSYFTIEVLWITCIILMPISPITDVIQIPT